MNIIEAIKSGRKFKRSGCGFYLVTSSYRFSTEDLLAEDWEIEEEKIEISRELLRRAFERTWALGGSYESAIYYLENELGFM